MVDIMFVILLIVTVNLFIVAGLYFGGLRNLTPAQGYFSFALIIAALIIIDIWIYRGLSAQQNAKCSKERIEQIFNEISKGNAKFKKELLECAGGDGNISIVVRDVAASQNVKFSGKTKKIKLIEYINSLEKTALGNKIAITEYRQDLQGQIIFLEITENYN
ncbi:MAG: hypothetical protein NZM38_07210 [Cytophagales bacterium]|nr:hypothetical protein [Cytophagales bacterium]MDW8384545.1 hypothetical protein [Flammeovirgaceae bacterium]